MEDINIIKKEVKKMENKDSILAGSSGKIKDDFLSGALVPDDAVKKNKVSDEEIELE